MSIFKHLLSSSSRSSDSRRKSEVINSFKDDEANDLSIVIENYDVLLNEANKNRRHSVPESVLSPGINSFLDTIDEVCLFFAINLHPVKNISYTHKKYTFISFFFVYTENIVKYQMYLFIQILFISNEIKSYFIKNYKNNTNY